MRKLLALVLLVCGSSFLFAQVPEVLLDGLDYRSVGPTRGGRATAIEGIPAQPFTFFMGATGGGVWKTDDAGQSWIPLGEGQIKAGSIGDITVAPSDPSTIYVGTGSAAPRGNISAGIGMYKTSDGGKKWTHIGLPEAGQIGRVLVHPADPDLVYVAALGHIFGKNAERGVYRSTNGGDDWEQILYLNDSTGAIDLAMNPHDPEEIYAAFWRSERKPWTLIDGGPDGGIWKTSNGGDDWDKLGGGLPTGILGKIGLAVSPANPEVVYAIIQAKEEAEGGLYRSDDAGASWRRVNRDHRIRQRGWYYSHITAHPTDPDEVYLSNTGFYRSIDGGKTLERIATPHGDNHGVWINPDNPSIMINCNDGGANVTLNGGKTWSTQLNQPTSEFYRVTVDNRFPYRLYAGQQDNTTISVPSHDPGGVTPYEHWIAVGGGESADVGVDPQNPDRVWAGTYSGEITILDRTTGHVRQVTAYPHYTEGTEMRDLKYRWQWNFPIVVSQHEPGTVYMTSNYVHRTTDDGQNWERISPDLTRNIDAYMDIPGGPVQHDATGVEVYASIFAFEESPHAKGEFWAGSDDGLLHVTRDGGDTWTEITPEGLPFEATINKIELSTHSPGRAIVAAYNYRYDDFTPYLFLTNDWGQSWTNIGEDLPRNHFVRAIAEDPDREGLLYAGTEFGMFISFDAGTTWQSFQQNLPYTPITDLEVHEQDLVISTQGRSFWIMDDLTPLHQMSPALAQQDYVLFEPRPAIRTTVRGYQARIHLYVSDLPEGEPVTVSITDEAGQPVRTLSTKADHRRDRIRVKEGMNVLTWDLRHSGPEVVDNLVTMVISNPPYGPYAVPGTYTVQVAAGDWLEETTLEVKSDPRWKQVEQADYAAQLTLAQDIAGMITEAHDRIKNIRALRKQMKTTAALAKEAGHGDELQELVEDIDSKLTAVEDQLIQNKAEASQDNINYPRVFSNHIGRLYSIVTRAHHRPTGGALERYEDLKQEYAGIVADYEQVMENDVPLFNRMLAQKQVPRLIVPKAIKK